MRGAVISDIHANLQAFEAVLTDIAAQKVDLTICLGDAVGYGPQPAEVLSLLHAHVHRMLMGNHEAAVAGLMDSSVFNDDARRMVEWTRQRLNKTAVEYLAGLPYHVAGDGFACVHGSFDAPAEFQYVETAEEARAVFASRPEPLLFVGHTHDPAIFVLDPSGACERCEPGPFVMEPGLRYLVNPGSVGLPRGGDFRASYCVFDTATREVSFNRVVYSVPAFRQQVERCAGDSEQVAYVLALFDSHALPVLNKRVDFAAPAPASRLPVAGIPSETPARPPARIVIRKPPAATRIPSSVPAHHSAPSKPAPRRSPVGAIVALLLVVAALAAALLILNNQSRKAAPPVLAAAPAPPAPPPATNQPPKPAVFRPEDDILLLPDGPAASAAPAPVPLPAPAASPAASNPAPPEPVPPRPEPVKPPPGSAKPPVETVRAPPTDKVWKANFKAGESQDFQWDAEGSWREGGFPNAPGAEAILDVGKSGIRDLKVNLGRDITVGCVRAIEGANASIYWQPGHAMIFDNGSSPAQWFRNKGSPQAGSLRLQVHTDLQLNSTLEAYWSVTRGIEVKNRIAGPGGLVIHHYSNDGPENNRRVQFQGEPNTYAGGTTLNGKVNASRPSLFAAEKNGAFGTGDVTLNELAHLTLADQGAADDMIADAAALRLTEAKGVRSRVILKEGVQETVGALFFNNQPQASGSWGSGTSGAQNKNDEFFSGPGQLIVRPSARGPR